MLNTTIAPSPSGGGSAPLIRIGATAAPLPKLLAQSTAKVFANALSPFTELTVYGQGNTQQTVLMTRPGLCSAPDGNQYPFITPYDTPVMYDSSFNLPTPNGPANDDRTQAVNTGNGNTVVLGRVKGPLKKLPYIAEVVVGFGLMETQYGLYDYTDAKGVTHPAKSVADPLVQKPKIDLKLHTTNTVADSGLAVDARGLYANLDPAYLSVDSQNRITLLAAPGTNLRYVPGTNVEFIPGTPPPDALTVVNITGGGSTTPGARLLAYCWIVPDGTGGTADTAPSPTTYANATPALGTINYSIPPASVPTTATGIKLLTTKVDDTSGDLYEAAVLTGVDVTTTITGTLAAADATFTTKHTVAPTKIAVTSTVALIGNVPDASHTHTPMGTLGLGAAVSKTADPAFTYAGAGNTGAHAFWGLDENAKADLAAAFSRNADGTWNPNPPLNITADWTKAGLDTHHPLVSQKLNGMGAFEQGVRTIYVNHTPTDADIPWPSWWGTMPDGWLAVNSVDDSLWWRSHGIWHTDDDSGCPDCLSGSGGPTSPGQTTTAGGGQSVAGGSGTIQPPSLGTITSSPAGPTPTAPTTGGNSTPGGAKQGYDCSGAPAVEETFTATANPGSFGFPFPTTDTVLSTISGHTITLLASSECDNGNVQTNASRGSNNSAFVLWHFNRGPDLQWVSMGIDTGNSPTLDRNIIGWHVYPSTIETVHSVNQLGAPSGNNDLWFGINFGCDNSIVFYEGPDATHLTEVLSPGGWGSGVPISIYLHGMTAFSAGSGTHQPGIIDNFHVYTGMPGWINWIDGSGVVHVATTSPPVFSNPVAPTAPSTVPVGEQTYWTQGYLAGMRGDEESTNPYYTAAMVANMGATAALAAAQAWNQGWVDAWNAQYAAPLKIMPGGSGAGTGGAVDGTSSSTTTTAPNAGLPNGTTTTTNLDGTTTTVVTSGATLAGGTWTGGTTTTTVSAPQVGSGGTASTQPVPVQSTLNVAGDLDVGGNTTLAGSLTVAQSSNPTQRTYITPLMVVASTFQSGNTLNTGTPGQTSGTTITKTGTYTPLVHATSEIVNDGVLQQGVIATPAAPPSGYGQLYAITVSGVAHPYWMGSDGIARDLIPDAAAQPANTVFAGPTSGAAAAPTFRTLVAADLPVPIRWELLMTDGVTNPPVPISTEDGTDWLYWG